MGFFSLITAVFTKFFSPRMKRLTPLSHFFDEFALRVVVVVYWEFNGSDSAQKTVPSGGLRGLPCSKKSIL